MSPLEDATAGIILKQQVAAGLLLCTGTSVALYGQVITNAGTTLPASQLIAWTKYAFNLCICSSVVRWSKSPDLLPNRKPRTLANRQAEVLAAILGLLDVVSYSLNCLGFPLCGSSLSMVIFAGSGQLFTAITRSVLLGKRISSQQTLAVLVVTVGLILRTTSLATLSTAAMWLRGASAEQGSSDSQSEAGQAVALGAAYLVASAAGYSLLGVLYEKLFSLPGNTLLHAHVSQRMSTVGLVAVTIYQVLFTWPNRQRLVLDPWKESGLSWFYALALHALFGCLFTLHSFVQGRVLERSGAMTVGVVNAARAASVTLCSALFFCNPNSPHQCLTWRSGLSALIITLGSALWVSDSSTHRHRTLKRE